MIEIRPATLQDVSLIVEFIRELAAYERAPHEAIVTEDDIRHDGFAGEPKFRVLIAEWEGEPAAFALFFRTYSTWMGRAGLYLEDLFVRPSFRKRGIGRQMLRYLAKLAVEEGCGRFEWNVLDWNTPAIDFYHSLGARPLTEWIRFRITGEPMKKLAEGYGSAVHSCSG
jgi:GNAT superfamily N-acetyltransferase